MNTKVILTTTALILSTALSANARCSGHSEQAMSCADGTVWDAQTNSCVPQINS